MDEDIATPTFTRPFSTLSFEMFCTEVLFEKGGPLTRIVDGNVGACVRVHPIIVFVK
jgi:hypothetical protein